MLFDRSWDGGLVQDLMRMQREMDRLFGTYQGGYRSRVFPAINIYESDDGYHLRAELPGIDPGSLDISVVRNELVIQGERRPQELPAGEVFHRQERDSGSFSRAFSLPEAIDAERVKASYKDGVLDLQVPRLPEAQPRKISVRSA